MNVSEYIDKRLAKLRSDLSAKETEIGVLDGQIRMLQEDCHAIAIAVRELTEVAQQISRESTNGQSKKEPDAKGRTSARIVELIEQSDDGLTAGEIWEHVKDEIDSKASNPRNTIGTTLYNLKKRGLIDHDKDTKKYTAK